MYKIETPNPHYDGDWNTLTFVNGHAHTDSDSIAADAERLGYTVTRIGRKPVVTEEPPSDTPESPVSDSEAPIEAPVRKPRASRKKA